MLDAAVSGLTPAQLQHVAASAILEVSAELDAAQTLRLSPLGETRPGSVANALLADDRLIGQIATAKVLVEQHQIEVRPELVRTDPPAVVLKRRGSATNLAATFPNVRITPSPAHRR